MWNRLWFRMRPTRRKHRRNRPTPEEPQTPEDPQTPVTPGIDPTTVYTPGTKTGETIAYSGLQIPVYAERDRLELYPGEFYWEGDRLVYAGSAFDTRFGIDVSAYQNRPAPMRPLTGKRWPMTA